MSDKNINHRNKNVNEKMKKQIKNKENKEVIEEFKPNYFLILIFIVLCIIPLIVRLKVYNNNFTQFPWFGNGSQSLDFFLFYKQWALIIITAIMAVIIVIKLINSKIGIKSYLVFIPLGVYAVLAFLSAVLSKYRSFSFLGSFEEFESVFVLLGYCILAFYSYLFIKSERDLKRIEIFIIAVAIIMGILGLSQFLGHDFFGTKLGYNLIMPEQYRNNDPLTFTMGKNRVYLTLYNPNYVGSFIALVLPIITFMIFFQKKLWMIILSIISICVLFVSLFGSGSLSGFIGLGASITLFLIFMWRYLLKRFYISIPVILICVVGLFYIDTHTNIQLISKLISNIHEQKTVSALKNLETKDNCITMNYNNNIMNVQFIVKDGQTASFVIYDENNQTISANYDENTNSMVVTDPRFSGIILGPDAQINGVFYIQAEGKNWRFTNQLGDGGYYYINTYNKADKMKTAPSFLFTGHESFASGRGYIWSRTIPLLKKYILLGSGPDTFAIAFPQQDYLHLAQSGYEGQILTKPHNLYLQMGVQTGLLSLIAFLLFYLIYFVSSIRLYLRGRFSCYYARVGVAIFIGTISYMVTGITNDSSVTTAPYFWVLIGVGIAVNMKAKPLIKQELEEIRQKKIEKRMNKKESK